MLCEFYFLRLILEIHFKSTRTQIKCFFLFVIVIRCWAQRIHIHYTWCILDRNTYTFKQFSRIHRRIRITNARHIETSILNNMHVSWKKQKKGKKNYLIFSLYFFLSFIRSEILFDSMKFQTRLTNNINGKKRTHTRTHGFFIFLSTNRKKEE